MTKWARLEAGTVAQEWALLGRAHELELEFEPNVRFIGRDFRGGTRAGWWLAADPRGGALLIGLDSHVLETDRPAGRYSLHLRERFTGRKPDGRRWELEEHLPAKWQDLGPASSILYESDKIHGGGTGRPELFRHEFSQGANAYRSGDLLAIVGDRIKVDAAGIRN